MFTFSLPKIYLSASLSAIPAKTSVPPSSNGSYNPLLRDLILNTLSFNIFLKPPLAVFAAFKPSLTLFNWPNVTFSLNTSAPALILAAKYIWA